jgi:hypothetical protein
MSPCRGLSSRCFAGHDVDTTQSVGWAGVGNGELLRRAAEARYGALITVDKGFEFQQDISRLPLTIAILRGRSNRLEDLQPLLPELIATLQDSEPCSLVKVGA